MCIMDQLETCKQTSEEQAIIEFIVQYNMMLAYSRTLAQICPFPISIVNMVCLLKIEYLTEVRMSHLDTYWD
jgi:hypothetical protein